MPPDPDCRYCNLPLDDASPFQVDIEGRGAHLACIPTLEEEDVPDADY